MKPNAKAPRIKEQVPKDKAFDVWELSPNGLRILAFLFRFMGKNTLELAMDAGGLSPTMAWLLGIDWALMRLETANLKPIFQVDNFGTFVRLTPIPLMDYEPIAKAVNERVEFIVGGKVP